MTVSSRVDGTITSVSFKQGQMVKSGDILAQIDPHPYQATVDAAIARKAQDEANLANDRLDLTRYASLASQQFASRQQLDTQRALAAQVSGDQAAIDGARTELDYTTIRSPISGKAGFRLIDPGNIVRAESGLSRSASGTPRPRQVSTAATESIQRASVQLSENAKAQVLNGLPSRSVGNGRPFA